MCKQLCYPYPSEDISNSTKEGARKVLLGWRLRGVVMEIRLMAARRAMAELLANHGAAASASIRPIHGVIHRVAGLTFCHSDENVRRSYSNTSKETTVVKMGL